jgi:predicted nuclease of predicted toxin-antitoxin system
MKFLLDENLEHEVGHRLEHDGHEVMHVGTSDRLQNGDSDETLATFSQDHRAVIVTYDDDFRDDFCQDEFHAVLYFPDQALSADTIATALHEISTYYQHSELRGFMTVGKSWL